MCTVLLQRQQFGDDAVFGVHVCFVPQLWPSRPDDRHQALDHAQARCGSLQLPQEPFPLGGGRMGGVLIGELERFWRTNVFRRGWYL